MTNPLLAEARAIARGALMRCAEHRHLEAYEDALTRAELLNGTLTRSLEMLQRLHEEELAEMTEAV